MQKQSEGPDSILQPEKDNFAEASFHFHQELAKLHQRVNEVSNKPTAKAFGSKGLPVLAFCISILSLGISAYNGYSTSRAQGNQAIQYINDLSTLVPPTDSNKTAQAGVAASGDNATYDYKVNEIENLINLSNKNSISKKMYVKLIRSTIAFKDVNRARKFLGYSDNAAEDDQDSTVQLALAWAQLADLTRRPEDLTPALKHLNGVLSTTDDRAKYQVQFMLIDMDLLSGDEEFTSPAANLESAKATLDRIGSTDKVYADQFRPALDDLERKIADKKLKTQRKLPGAPISKRSS